MCRYSLKTIQVFFHVSRSAFYCDRLRCVSVLLLSGTYTCTFFQKNLPSSARTAVEVVPLPLKQNIFLDPIEAFIRCKIQQELKCCTNKMENYNVTFTVESTTFFPGKRYDVLQWPCKTVVLNAYDMM